MVTNHFFRRRHTRCEDLSGFAFYMLDHSRISRMSVGFGLFLAARRRIRRSESVSLRGFVPCHCGRTVDVAVAVDGLAIATYSKT